MGNINTQNKVATFWSMLCLLMCILAISTSSVADGGRIYSIYDTDRNGYLDKTEFVKFADSRREHASSPDFWEFSRVDADGDQKISE